MLRTLNSVSCSKMNRNDEGRRNAKKSLKKFKEKKNGNIHRVYDISR